MASKRQRRKRRRHARRPAADPGRDPSPGAEPGVRVDDAARARAAADRAAKGPPPAPWGSFPLSELIVLVAVVMLVAGFVIAPPRGTALLGTGLVLGSLAGLELAIREHFAGYKSHTLLLAGAVGVAVVAGLYFLGPGSLTIWMAVLAGCIAFAVCVWLLIGAFRRRSGGASYRFRGG
jgi:hypothetical protein